MPSFLPLCSLCLCGEDPFLPQVLLLADAVALGSQPPALPAPP